MRREASQARSVPVPTQNTPLGNTAGHDLETLICVHQGLARNLRKRAGWKAPNSLHLAGACGDELAGLAVGSLHAVVSRLDGARCTAQDEVRAHA